jgi:hypothetical protein
MQKLSNSIKKLNLRIMDIEEEEEQTKGIITYSVDYNRKFSKSSESFAHSVIGSFQTPNRLDQNSTSQQRIIIKTASIESRERILKALRKTTNNI